MKSRDADIKRRSINGFGGIAMIFGNLLYIFFAQLLSFIFGILSGK